MKNYQKGELPTVEEMKEFSNRFSKDDWKKLTNNVVFLKYYDKNLNAVAIAAEMILAGKYVGSFSDIKLSI